MLEVQGKGGDGRRGGAGPSITNNLILKRLMWPLAATLLVLAGVIGLFMWHEYEDGLQETIARRIEEIPHRLQAAQAQELAVMTALLERITASGTLHEALRNRDRERLLADHRELLQALRRQYRISHFYFQDGDRNNIARVQFPEKTGGRIDRYTTLQAQRTGKTAGGLELGSFGLLSLRVVQPVFSGGRLIGFVELGKEIDDILAGLHQSSDVEVAVVIHKDVVTREGWETGMKLVRGEFRWDDLPHDVLSYSSLWPLPAGVLDHLVEHAPVRLSIGERVGDDRSWRSASLPIRDASGRDVGHLLVMLDISASEAAFRRSALTAFAISAVVLLLLLGFLYRLLRNTDARLLAQQTELQKTEAMQRAIFDTVIDGIVMTDERGLIKLVNPAFEKIFGYRLDEVQGRNVSMLMPEPERSAHDGYIHSYLASGERKIIGIGREVVGQRKDGSVFPMDLSISETLIEGRRLFTGLMRDVTARKQAETDLIKSLQLQREYERHASVDALTGLYNRRWMDATFARQIARCGKEGQALSLIMLDVDRFKDYNDTLGHRAGDCALRALGKAIAEHIRPNDLATRYGGEEFALLLPNTCLATAVTVAERLRKEVEKTRVPAPEGGYLPSITLSLGVAEMRQGDTLETLVAAADTALYQAKQSGRNCVRIHVSAPAKTAGAEAKPRACNA